VGFTPRVGSISTSGAIIPLSKFSDPVAARLLADCKRHCCVCLAGGRALQIHHITPEAEGGTGKYDNGIPVCLDCHARIESKSNMGRSFTPKELRLHRERWFETVAKNPEVLIRAAQTTQTQTGPLEALLAELNFNLIACAGPADESFPPLAVEQFKRAIATNAVAALDDTTRLHVLLTYKRIAVLNQTFEDMAHADRHGGSGSQWAGVRDEQGLRREETTGSIQDAMNRLATALGWGEYSFARNPAGFP
jgi:HNH endonuclease